MMNIDSSLLAEIPNSWAAFVAVIETTDIAPSVVKGENKKGVEWKG